MRTASHFLLSCVLLTIILDIGLGSSGYTYEALTQTSQIQFVELGQYDSGGIVFGVEIIDEIAYIADFGRGLIILNISDPCNPTELGSFYDGGNPHDIFLSDNLAYMANHGNGLEIFNITNPNHPTKVGQIIDSGDGQADGVFVSNNRVYVAEWYDSTWSWKMIIINVTNPANPIKIAEYADADGQFFRFYTEGDILYTSCFDDGFKILNISMPTNIIELGRFYDGGSSSEFQVVDSIAYIADGGGGLELLNISDPASPVKLGEYDDEGTVFDVKISEEVAYIAGYGTGLTMLNISNPANITLLGQYSSEDVTRFDIQDDYAYLALGENGLRILKIGESAEIGCSTTINSQTSTTRTSTTLIIQSTTGWTFEILIAGLAVMVLLYCLKRSKS
ncbi:MAG: LVIVD repeat-containing protein [Promethearchaeota archaeon]